MPIDCLHAVQIHLASRPYAWVLVIRTGTDRYIQRSIVVTTSDREAINGGEGGYQSGRIGWPASSIVVCANIVAVAVKAGINGGRACL